MAGTLTLPRSQTRPASSAKRTRLREYVPIALILVTQAVYTIRLISIGYLSTDEARYIVAGHVLIHELFHGGGGSPFYETFFSGAPDVYSPLAAMADYVGGVAAVRLMSLCFMLIATYLLYRSTERLVGYVAAVCAAGMFAALGMTQVVGRNTIYDAMAFMLMAVAGYCAVRSRDGRARWLLLVPLALFAAYFTKYMTFLFDPVVIAMASFGVGSWKESLRRLLTLGFTTLAVEILGVFLAGWAYLKGMTFTVFSRGVGTDAVLGVERLSAHTILSRTWTWMGLLLALAVIGAVWGMIERRKDVGPVLAICAVAGFAVTLEALHLHAAESMRRHDDLGAWFAAIPAGYALALPANLMRTIAWKRVLACAGLVVVVASWSRYGQLPSDFTKISGYDTGNGGNPAPLALAMKPYLVPGHEYLLSGLDNYSTIYYSHVSLPWYEYATDDNYIKYPIPGRGGNWAGSVLGPICKSLKPGCTYLEGPAAYTAAIKAHAFAMIELEQRFPSLPTDTVIQNDLLYSQYIPILLRGYYQVWVYLPDYPHHG